MDLIEMFTLKTDCKKYRELITCVDLTKCLTLHAQTPLGEHLILHLPSCIFHFCIWLVYTI